MLDIATLTLWLITVNVQFENSDQTFSTYNTQISFQHELVCNRALSRTEQMFEKSFLEYWYNQQDQEEYEDLTIKNYNFSCKEWYLASDGEWYMVGEVPIIET